MCTPPVPKREPRIKGVSKDATCQRPAPATPAGAPPSTRPSTGLPPAAAAAPPSAPVLCALPLLALGLLLQVQPAPEVVHHARQPLAQRDLRGGARHQGARPPYSRSLRPPGLWLGKGPPRTRTTQIYASPRAWQGQRAQHIRRQPAPAHPAQPPEHPRQRQQSTARRALPPFPSLPRQTRTPSVPLQI